MAFDSGMIFAVAREINLRAKEAKVEKIQYNLYYRLLIMNE